MNKYLQDYEKKIIARVYEVHRFFILLNGDNRKEFYRLEHIIATAIYISLNTYLHQPILHKTKFDYGSI